MTFNKNAFVFLLFIIAFTEVTSWTVDLPEVRKFLFEKYDHTKKGEDYVNDGRKFYSNIDGNSMHHDESYKDDGSKSYAKDYGYISYMQKKVNSIVSSGSAYLEGLRRAIERYTQFLESCNNRNNSTSRNLTAWRLPIDSSMPSDRPMPSNFSMLSPPSFNFTRPSPPSLIDLETPRGSYNASNMSINCEEISRRSENVRRLAQLAMWSTMRLQDLAYASQYRKIDQYEENELILKLAWYLDRLAYLTGYEPEPREFLPTTTQGPTTVSPTPYTVAPAPQPIKTFLMDCLKENSSIPATVRCRYPLPVPEIIRQVTNRTGEMPMEATLESMEVIPMPDRDSIPQQSLELLITSDNNPFRNYPPFPRPKRHIDDKHGPSYNLIKNPFSFIEYVKNHLTGSKSIVNRIFNSGNFNQMSSSKQKIDSKKAPSKKRLVEYATEIPIKRIKDNTLMSTSKKLLKLTTKYNNKKIIKTNFLKLTPVKSIKKRSADNPLSKIMNYYFKYKVWDNSNPVNKEKTHIVTSSQHFDVDNHLKSPKSIRKRSLVIKKGDGQVKVLTPLKNLRNFIKHKQRIHYNTFVIQKPRIVSHLENIRHQINLNKGGKVDLKKGHIKKRSIYFGNMYLPRESENPMQDISFYVKNKRGRNYNPSLTQAAQIRLGLEQIFQTGNIEVVRRYGSNYNPANPAPFYTGLLLTMADS